MLRLRRRPVKTHARLAKDELSEGLDHLVQAANHAAGGVGATVGPRVHAARDRVAPAADRMRTVAATGFGTTAAALTPLAVAAREGSRKAIRRTARASRKQPETSSRHWSRTALLVAGAAVGLAGAVIMRRRRQQQQWEEYDPGRPLESTTGPASEVPHRVADSVTTTAETLAKKASSAIDAAAPDRGTTGRADSVPAPAPTPVAPPPGIATPVPATDSPSRNSRN